MNDSGKLSPADEEIFNIDTILDSMESRDASRNIECTEDSIEKITYSQYKSMFAEGDDCYLLFEGSRVTLAEIATIVRNQREIYGVDILNGNFLVPNCEEKEIGLDANSIAMIAMYDFIENGEILSDTAVAEITKMCDAWNKKHAIKKISNGKYLVDIEKELKELEESYKNEVYEF